MPCRDDYSSSPDYSSTEINDARAEARRNEKRADLAARVACELEKKYIKSDKELEALSKETQVWIAEHRIKDAKEKAEQLRQERLERQHEERRKKEAALKTSALGKLTHEERRALGLPDPAHQ
jgi:hypothetical protein